jgi:ketol-acid reductoisomerase
VRQRMREILDEIQSGRFAKEFILENQAGALSFQALRNRGAQHPMEKVGARLRELMPWLKENRLVDRTKN